ncbi:glycerol dehydrogenase [Bradyrhizobium sp. G127]|uniref:glycerol dehydrogenase n=1 Tax=Bradyrhizobium sp. G127 TaxID=2904800 RepID=UPI001F209888|nr:glycerol dehydrogenase [Bradyrhizobium sp. G127]MCF2524694.1 glycerol dehydrogenase [Bradyrhizobium sp. G127]
MTIRAFGGPHRYVQGPGALGELATLVPMYGRRPFILADIAVLGFLRAQLETLLQPRVDAVEFSEFSGECSAAQIDAMAAKANAAKSDVVVAIGGGKAIDTAKGVRILRGGGIIVVPTVASNDAPTSRLAIVYSDDHVLKEVRLMPTNPDAVVVDTSIIARAPRRFFVAGIGDALTKKFEAEQCYNSGGLNFYKARPAALAVSIAAQCYQVIRRDAIAALAAVDRKEPDEAFENVVEATILLSGLGFESGGLSIAHSLTRGFSALPSLNASLHGEQVAFGLLAQLCLEQRSTDFLADIVTFYRAVGLPVSLKDLGFSGEVQDGIRIIAQRSLAEAPYLKQFVGQVHEQNLVAALEKADRLAG